MFFNDPYEGGGGYDKKTLRKTENHKSESNEFPDTNYRGIGKRSSL